MNSVMIDPEISKELEYMVQLHRQHGAANAFNNVQDLVDFVLRVIADGSRRPGSWERGVLVQIGLIADTDEHQIFRWAYGPAESESGSEQ